MDKNKIIHDIAITLLNNDADYCASAETAVTKYFSLLPEVEKAIDNYYKNQGLTDIDTSVRLF